MPDNNFTDAQIEDLGNNKPEEHDSGLGAYLRSEREEKGFTLDELAARIRIRRRFLEALEDEDWENLPSPVFVKGFIRSYCKALEMDRYRALDLYKKNSFSHDDPPRPLVESKRSKQKVIIYPILVVGFIAIFVYLWIIPESIVLGPERSDNREMVIEGSDEVAKSSENPSEEKVLTVDKEPIQDSGIESNAFSEPEEIPRESPSEDLATDQLKENSSDVLPVVEQDESNNVLVLTGKISMRTYIRIYIDDDLPKEYIFEPGSRPQWKANKGFEVLVGNAAGIELNFNGEKITDLGGPGKVIRVRLPENFRSSVYEE